MNFFYTGAIPSPKVKRTQQNNGTHMPTDSSKKANNSATHYACPQVNTLNNIIILFGFPLFSQSFSMIHYLENKVGVIDFGKSPGLF